MCSGTASGTLWNRSCSISCLQIHKSYSSFTRDRIELSLKGFRKLRECLIYMVFSIYFQLFHLWTSKYFTALHFQFLPAATTMVWGHVTPTGVPGGDIASCSSHPRHYRPLRGAPLSDVPEVPTQVSPHISSDWHDTQVSRSASKSEGETEMVSLGVWFYF